MQNFPTNPTPDTPNAPPLPTGATPEVSPLLEPNNSDNDSHETSFDTKTGNTFLDNNGKSLRQTHICKKLTFTHSPFDRGSLNCWLYNLKSQGPMIFLPFPYVKKC